MLLEPIPGPLGRRTGWCTSWGPGAWGLVEGTRGSADWWLGSWESQLDIVGIGFLALLCEFGQIPYTFWASDFFCCCRIELLIIARTQCLVHRKHLIHDYHYQDWTQPGFQT